MNSVFDTARTLHQKGHLAEAEALYKRVLDQHPRHGDAWAMMGALCVQTGHHDHAISHLETAIQLEEGKAQTWSNYGLALERAGRHQDALGAYQKALKLQPDYIDAYNNLGRLLADTGNLEQARAVYLLGLELANEEPGLLLNLANLLRQAGEYNEALLFAQRAVELAPDNIHPRLLQIDILLQIGEQGDAWSKQEELAQLFPDDPFTFNITGILLSADNDFEGAAKQFRQALVRNPSYAQGYYNLGNALQAIGRNDEALEAFDAALKFHPDYMQAALNRSMLLLDLGRFNEGWPGFENRFLVAGNRKRQFASRPWEGKQDVKGKTILLWNEQGFGDSIQFARYGQVLKHMGATVILQVQPELVRLFDNFDGADQVISDADIDAANARHIDFNAPLLSLPLYLGTSIDTIPTSKAYLTAPSPVQQPGDRLKIGLVWAGQAGHANDKNRSLPLSLFAPLLEDKRVDWFSFQMGDAKNQLAAFPQVTDLGGMIKDFADTANLMAGMDNIISVDTAPAHLAGALGIKTNLLVPRIHDWRWGQDRFDSPWYESVTLYRQRDIGGAWHGAMAALSQDIEAILDQAE